MSHEHLSVSLNIKKFRKVPLIMLDSRILVQVKCLPEDSVSGFYLEEVESSGSEQIWMVAFLHPFFHHFQSQISKLTWTSKEASSTISRHPLQLKRANGIEAEMEKWSLTRKLTYEGISYCLSFFSFLLLRIKT